MKRVIKFQALDEKYVFLEEDIVVFEIDKNDLIFNVKAFYNAFFSEGLDYSEIELQNDVSDDKEATRIFECVKSLNEQIVEKLEKELNKL